MTHTQTLRKHMQYLSSHQAMADYAELLHEVKKDLDAQEAPVIGFGGSYGGMLAAWMRCVSKRAPPRVEWAYHLDPPSIKYPHMLDGAIAASAPIWTFYGEHPKWYYMLLFLQKHRKIINPTTQNIQKTTDPTIYTEKHQTNMAHHQGPWIICQNNHPCCVGARWQCACMREQCAGGVEAAL